MQANSTYTIHDNRIQVTGAWCARTLNMAFLKDWHHLIEEGFTLVRIDCKNLESIDCVGIALIIDCIKKCRQLKKKCLIQHFPANMKLLAQLYLSKHNQSLFHDAEEDH